MAKTTAIGISRGPFTVTANGKQVGKPQRAKDTAIHQLRDELQARGGHGVVTDRDGKPIVRYAMTDDVDGTSVLREK